MVTVVGNRQVQIIDETVCISYIANTLRNDINPIIFSTGKLLGRLGF